MDIPIISLRLKLIVNNIKIYEIMGRKTGRAKPNVGRAGLEKGGKVKK